MIYNSHIETVIDVLYSKTMDTDVELQIHSGCDDRSVAIVENTNTRRFGIIATNIEEYPDEPLVLFTFNGQLYEYCKAEGFDQSDMVNKKGFNNKVLKKVNLKELVGYILNI